MKLSEKLRKKIFDKFPQTKTESNQESPLIAIKGISDGCRYKWANGLNDKSHIFSYNTMKECLDNEIFIDYHYGFDGNCGWEIFIK